MDKLTTLSNTIKDNDETQQILADKIGVNRNQVRRWINGESEMGIYKLKAICEYYKVSADYILGLAPDLDWPRGKGEKEHTRNRTKYTFLYNTLTTTCERLHITEIKMPHMGHFVLVLFWGLPKIVIETR